MRDFSAIDAANAACKLWLEMPTVDLGLYLSQDFVYHVDGDGPQVEITVNEGERQLMNDFLLPREARCLAALLLGAAMAIEQRERDSNLIDGSLSGTTPRPSTGTAAPPITP